jgi:Icc-related predicted phosphoesterase
MIRIAAVGDVHLGEDNRGRLRPRFADIGQRADALLLAGDLTQHGSAGEGRIVAEEFRDLGVPVVAVLGNHDYHADAQADITASLIDAGIDVLEGTGTVIECNGDRVGVAGTKGFGGGFPGRCATAFGEPQVKSFIAYSEELADGLRESLAGLDADFRIALTHYAPVKDTLAGEPTEIYPFLGSYLLAEAVDDAAADLAVHGHAHAGTEKGMTSGGVRVRNVAMPVLGKAYAIYCLGAEDAHC